MRGREIELERERECVYVNEKEGRERESSGGKSVDAVCGRGERGDVSGMEKGRGGCNGYAYV